MRIASLPMYDADPEAVDAWWQAISRALRVDDSVLTSLSAWVPVISYSPLTMSTALEMYL